jgi:redox-sensitive bicupin YhaK (pirin superfamily)
VKEFGMEAVNRRIVRLVTTAAPAEVLPGIAHTSLISPEERELSDPFLLLSDDRIDGGHGARVGGAHPHAGMESATLLLEGSIKDGDATPLQAGDLQWMTAGSGIVHDEAVIARGSVRLLQLWITLPHGRRWTAPGFQDVHLDSLPIRREPGVVVRLYSGRSGALVSPTRNQVPVTLAEFLIEAGSSLDQELPLPRTTASSISSTDRCASGPTSCGRARWAGSTVLRGRCRAICISSPERAARG